MLGRKWQGLTTSTPPVTVAYSIGAMVIDPNRVSVQKGCEQEYSGRPRNRPPTFWSRATPPRRQATASGSTTISRSSRVWVMMRSVTVCLALVLVAGRSLPTTTSPTSPRPMKARRSSVWAGSARSTGPPSRPDSSRDPVLRIARSAPVRCQSASGYPSCIK